MGNFTFNDGGRAEAGFVGKSKDCVARAVSIASGRPYVLVFDDLSKGCRSQRKTKRSRVVKDAGNGVPIGRKWFKDYMSKLGFRWVSCMGIGTGCKVHLKARELPLGRLVVRVSKHLVAVIDGHIHDTFDCTRAGTRCVYGYWILIN